MKAQMSQVAVAAAGLSLLLLGGCGSDDKSSAPKLPKGSEPIRLDPAEFTTRIDNPYWPMTPGTKWTYRETEDGSKQRVEVTVTRGIKKIVGVRARVVHDVVTQGGRLKEDTYDWYAQDKAGNIWYLGENTKEYERGKVSTTKGSWQAGVDGAQAGVIVPAHPNVGMTYRQEYYAGEAEDSATVLSIDEQAEVPFGHFTGVLLTKDYTPLEPKVLEYKLYARGVGPVLVLGVSGGADREELLRFTKTG
jgi:major membrane immunogen (membrane-anchored lipoprotein)